MSNLYQLLPKLGYSYQATIGIDCDMNIWLIESGINNFSEYHLTETTWSELPDIGQVAYEGGELSVHKINPFGTLSPQPVARDMAGILHLLTNLSGKRWCYNAIGESDGLFSPIDEVREWKDVKTRENEKIRDERTTWELTFDISDECELIGIIKTLSKEDIDTILM